MIFKSLVFSGFLVVSLIAPLQAQYRPNIVWLMAEDIGQDLACYGMKGLQTPTLDRLATEGRKYNNAICANPICSPNRSAMMVGVNPTIINAHMHRSNRDLALPAPYKPITSYLRDAGYT
ncbi:MAG: sulfatase-like hydrolase/transferase, partial [Opitutales bacterium]|nr:sulfatase-like hydrolase/transferase [Opitutales bacterium]